MPKRVRSAKGEIVDFDLMKIKEQIEAAPEPTSVQARQDFIDQKMRRRVKKIKQKLDAIPKRRVGPDGNVIVDKKVATKSAPEGEKIDVVEEKAKTAPKKTSTKKRKIKRKTKPKKVD